MTYYLRVRTVNQPKGLKHSLLQSFTYFKNSYFHLFKLLQLSFCFRIEKLHIPKTLFYFKPLTARKHVVLINILIYSQNVDCNGLVSISMESKSWFHHKIMTSCTIQTNMSDSEASTYLQFQPFFSSELSRDSKSNFNSSKVKKDLNKSYYYDHYHFTTDWIE